MTRAPGDWAGGAANLPEGEEDDWEEPPLPRMCWEYVMAHLSAIDKRHLDGYSLAHLEQAQEYGLAHAKALRGERRGAA
jgi:hypothetical protein